MTRATSDRAAIALSESMATDEHNNAHERRGTAVAYVESVGRIASCGCVLADDGEWTPCAEHDLALAVMTATDVYDTRYVADVWAHKAGGRSGAHWRYTLPQHVRTALAARPITPLPLIERSGVMCEIAPDSPALRAMLRDAREDAWHARQAEREARQAARGHLGEATTRKGREAQRKANGGKRRTAAQVAEARHNNAHESQAVDVERLARLAQALAVSGDTWADRQG